LRFPSRVDLISPKCYMVVPFSREPKGVSSPGANGVSLPIPILRFRGFRKLQSLSAGASGRPIGLPPPLPSLGCPRTLGSLTSDSRKNRFRSYVHPLLLFDATLAPLPPAHRSLRQGPGRLAGPPQQAPRWSVSTLQHVRMEQPFFPPFPRRPGNVALPPESPALRVCLPSRRR
jgi:hypothetical protein